MLFQKLIFVLLSLQSVVSSVDQLPSDLASIFTEAKGSIVSFNSKLRPTLGQKFPVLSLSSSASAVLSSTNILGCRESPNGNCKVALKSHHGKYVVAEANGEAKADRSFIWGDWEIWTATFIGDDQVQFKGAHGKYLVAERNGDANANRAAASIWETFTVVDKGNGNFAFKSYHGKYLVAEPNGALNANQNYVSIRETFEVTRIL